MQEGSPGARGGRRRCLQIETQRLSRKFSTVRFPDLAGPICRRSPLKVLRWALRGQSWKAAADVYGVSPEHQTLGA